MCLCFSYKREGAETVGFCSVGFCKIEINKETMNEPKCQHELYHWIDCSLYDGGDSYNIKCKILYEGHQTMFWVKARSPPMFPYFSTLVVYFNTMVSLAFFADKNRGKVRRCFLSNTLNFTKVINRLERKIIR
jgi:hypothetical protein